MRALGRLVAASLVGAGLFVGCVASPDTTRVASRRPVGLSPGEGSGVSESVENVAVPPVDTAAPATIAAPARRSSEDARSRGVRREQRVASGQSASVARAPRPAAPASRSKPTRAPNWERMQGEVGEGPFTVAQASRDGLPVSVKPGEEPAIHLGNPTPNGSPRVVLVVADAGDWFKVLLPVRPNSSLGWVRKADVSVSTNGYYAIVEQGAYRIRVYEAGRLIVDEPVAVGKGATPTPIGQFFVTDLLQPTNPNGAYGPYAFGLSGYSDVYQKFGSGDGVVGIHGTNDPSSVGRDASQGCIRVTNDVIRHLASILPLGTPISIRP